MRIFFILLQLLITSLISAQPITCVDPPRMTSFCNDACIICDIDGFSGRHNATIVGESPPGFAGECTFVSHNMQWISFIAGSIDLSVRMSVSNCDDGLGLEFGLYEGIDCQNYRRISNCFGGAAGIVGPGQSGTINNTEPLVIGQYYYIVMDGGLGDNCDWTFTVLSGSTKSAPLLTSGEIIGPANICPNFDAQYLINAPTGATEFEISLNGEDIGTSLDNPITVNYPDEGVYTLCVTARNRCEIAPPTCIEVNVANVPGTEIVEIVCEGECLTVADTTLCETGFYQFLLMAFNGCDSLVTVDLTQLLTPVSNLDLLICEGDTFFVGSTPFLESGTFVETTENINSCDSVVNLTLQAIVCNIESTAQILPVDCFGKPSGQINFSVDTGTPPFTYQWEALDGFMTGNGNVNTLATQQVINNLPSGTYSITIEDNFNNTEIIIARVNQPGLLEVDFQISDYTGFAVSCPEAMDGSILAQLTGGRIPYNYNWNNGNTTNTINQLGPGIYQLMAIDGNGCTITAEVLLNAPTPILVIADFQNPNCEGFESGMISIVNTSGGSGGYTYQLNQGAVDTITTFTGLGERGYEILVTDDNGCQGETAGALVAPQIPIIDLGPDTLIRLGRELELDPLINNIDIDTFSWLATSELDCEACLNPSTLPLNDGFYQLRVTSADGCNGSDSLFLRVGKPRTFFVPSAFSPNGDGQNDGFTIYGDNAVEEIRSLRIYDRWGGLLYEGKNLEPGNERMGWNGRRNGEDMDLGVYIWVAEIRFIDGVEIAEGGDITLLR